MKEETLEHQLEHCVGKDCTCAARGECECACGADWMPAEVYLLRDQADALRKDAERIRWLAANMRLVYGRCEVGGYELPDLAIVESCREFCDPQHLREAIDAAMNGSND
jgi:hypothetical protein